MHVGGGQGQRAYAQAVVGTLAVAISLSWRALFCCVLVAHSWRKSAETVSDDEQFSCHTCGA